MGMQPEPLPTQEQVKVRLSETSPNQSGHGAVPVAPTQPKQMPRLCVSLCKTSSRKRQVKTVLHFRLLLQLKFTLHLNPNCFSHKFHPTVTPASPTCHSQVWKGGTPAPTAEPGEQGAAAEGQIHHLLVPEPTTPHNRPMSTTSLHQPCSPCCAEPQPRQAPLQP